MFQTKEGGQTKNSTTVILIYIFHDVVFFCAFLTKVKQLRQNPSNNKDEVQLHKRTVASDLLASHRKR